MIHFIVGSTGAGKTTYAHKLARQRGAVLFAIDDWMHTLFFPDLEGEISFDWAMERIVRCEELIWQSALQVLSLEKEVILEISLSTRALREKHIQRAQASGMDYQIHYLDIDRHTRLERVLKRNTEKGKTYRFEVDEGMFDFVEDMFEPPAPEELEGAIIIDR